MDTTATTVKTAIIAAIAKTAAINTTNKITTIAAIIKIAKIAQLFNSQTLAPNGSLLTFSDDFTQPDSTIIITYRDDAYVVKYVVDENFNGQPLICYSSTLPEFSRLRGFSKAILTTDDNEVITSISF